MDHANETPVDRRLRRQQEQARNSGRKVCATWSTQHVELTPHPAGTRIGSGVNGPFWLLITRTRGSRALFRGGWLTRSCSRIGFQAGQMPDNGLSFQCLLAQDVGRWAISISCLQEAWLRMARCHVASGIQRPLVCCPTMHSNPAFVGRSWNEGDLLMHFESMQGVPFRLRHDSTGATSVTRWSAFCRRRRSFRRLWSLSFRAGVWTHFCMKATAFRLRSLSGSMQTESNVASGVQPIGFTQLLLCATFMSLECLDLRSSKMQLAEPWWYYCSTIKSILCFYKWENANMGLVLQHPGGTIAAPPLQQHEEQTNNLMTL